MSELVSGYHKTVIRSEDFGTWFADGGVLVCEMTLTTVDDWRDTCFGPCNFGYARFGPRLLFIEYPDGRRRPTTFEGAVFISEADERRALVKPKKSWWRFWE